MTHEQAMAEIRRQLEAVTDPEMDESILALGFIQELQLHQGGRIAMTLRLPTFWCAANFVFMMAEDARERLKKLPWVRHVSIQLLDHYEAEAINAGLAAERSFDAAFTEAGGDLTELRRVFRAKAFMSRQEKLLRHLLASYSEARVVALTLEQLDGLQMADPAAARLKERYLALRAQFGRVTASSPAFVRPGGEALGVGQLAAYIAELRRTSANLEFNAVLCRSLLKTRYDSTVVPENGRDR